MLIKFSLFSTLCLSIALAFGFVQPVAHAEDRAGTFRVRNASSLMDLEQALVERAPEVVVARREAALSDAEVRQSHLYNNPQLDAAWSTLPVGATNPTGLAQPYANIPS